MAKSAVPDNSPGGFPDHGVVPLESVLCTEELLRRPSRSPNYELADQVLNNLLQALADSPSTILETLAEFILKLCDCDSAGVSILVKETGGERFYWPAIAGEWNTHIGGGTPRDFSPFGDVLDRNAPVLFKHFERRYKYLSSITPLIEECLIVPIYIQGKAVGTVWAATHNDHHRFDVEDLHRLESLGRFAAAAYQTLRRSEALDRGARDPEHDEVKLSEQKAELDKAVAGAHDVHQSTLNSINDAALAREALHLSEERFRMLADNMSPLAWICDQLGNVTWYNKRWLDYTGMAFEQMAGWDWSKVQHPDYVERVVQGVKRSRDSGEVWEDTFPLRGKDGTYRWFLSRAIPIRDTAGNVVQWFGTNTDVTENRLTEAALIKSEKLAAAGRLAFVLAHEINNPLQAVTNLMALLETSDELHDSTRTHARMAADELARISHLTRQSLKFYREPTSPGPVDVQEALDGVLDFYARQCENRGIAVSKQYRSKITIQSYAGEIRQVITTLLINAMEAIPTAGTIVVHVRQVGLRKNRGPDGVRIAIADTGTGIAKENVSRIFEPFFTTKGQQGTGLGLWVAQGIVSRLGGSMKVRSSVHPQRSGTVFSIFFPTNLPGQK